MLKFSSANLIVTLYTTYIVAKLKKKKALEYINKFLNLQITHIYIIYT